MAKTSILLAREKWQRGHAVSARDQAKAHQHKSEIEFAATHTTAEVLSKLNSSITGLSEEGVALSREAYGVNEVTKEKKASPARLLLDAFVNPFTAILTCLAVVSAFTDMVFPAYSLFGSSPNDFNAITVLIITVMVVISGMLRFVQESRSGNATERLLNMITTTCTVTRINHRREEIPIDDLVVGDIVHLSVGDMVPADVRILEAKDLFVSQASLTGEAEPLEKLATQNELESAVTEYTNIAFMGSNVVAGTASGVVVEVGDNTIFGRMTAKVAQEHVETNFTKGVNQVSWVLIRFMMVMVPIVFLINGFTKGDWLTAFLFAISVAVGLTPEMLPMIVTTCLAKGAVSMSRKKTIVKNLNSIQNFGAIDVLCTDKTGTLTEDKVVLELSLNVSGDQDNRVLRHAYLNSYFQTGYKNLMDKAIIKHTEEQEANDPQLTDLSEEYEKVDELPFDFTRRRLSIAVRDKKGKTQMVTKGALEEMLSICSYVEENGKAVPLTKKTYDEILKRTNELNEQGFRVLGLAQKTNLSHEGTFSEDDEKDMIFMGYLAFLDAPKQSAVTALKALSDHGVTTKILTGDNEKVTRAICRQLDLPIACMMLGDEVEQLDDAELGKRAEKCDVFAKLTPDQKVRIVRVLRDQGHAVGYMGDGINDAAAMKASDIGVSVDSAVDVAKESADIILLEKDLTVLDDGIIEGRKTYANMIKYIKMTASSNFGNMFSVLIASAFLPFLPMMSVQLILLNLLYDFTCIAIPWDNVDKEYLKIPRTWDASSVGRFMIWIGPTSSVFDILTYLVLFFIICPMVVGGSLYWQISDPSLLELYVATFQAGWFIESMWTQTLVIHMIRTRKIPFIESHAAAPLILLTLAGIAVVTIIPFSSLGTWLGLAPLPPIYFVWLIVLIFGYMVLVTFVKLIYIKRYKTFL